MAHPYPPHWIEFPYVGRHYYSLTYPTDNRRTLFVDRETVDRAWTQILRGAREKSFGITAYCFMPDHLHLIVHGITDQSDCKAFIKSAKQYCGYYHSRATGGARLLGRYGEDRVIRDEHELAMTVRYVVANPVRAGLVRHPRDYPFLGSQEYTVEELLKWCEYTDDVALN